MTVEPTAQDLEIHKLAPSEFQVRTRNVSRDIDELVDSIRVNGQLQPILVYVADDEDDTYKIVAGQRRWLAMKALGMRTIRALVLGMPPEDTTARAMSLAENVIRRDVDTKDKVDACTELYRKYGTVKDVSEATGLPISKVRDYVKFDRLNSELKDAVTSGTIDIRPAMRLQNYADEHGMSDSDIQSAASALSAMTTAQQRDYLQALRDSGSLPLDPGPGEACKVPGDVHQIIANIRGETHRRLKETVKYKQTTQEELAGQIIEEYFAASEGLREASSI